MPAGWPGGKLIRSLSKGIQCIRPFVNVAVPLSTVFDRVRVSALVNAMPISGERRSTMDEDLRKRVIAYRVAMSIIRGLVLDGTISEEEYVNIDTIIAKKYGLDSCTIFR